MINANSCTIIDVRSADEFDRFRIPNAINIDILSTSAYDELASLPRDGKYLIYCALGVRSRSAIKLMEQLGFSNLNHLTNGILNFSGAIDNH